MSPSLHKCFHLSFWFCLHLNPCIEFFIYCINVYNHLHLDICIHALVFSYYLLYYCSLFLSFLYLFIFTLPAFSYLFYSDPFSSKTSRSILVSLSHFLYLSFFIFVSLSLSLTHIHSLFLIPSISLFSLLLRNYLSPSPPRTLSLSLILLLSFLPFYLFHLGCLS